MWSKKLMVAVAFSSIMCISFIQGAPNNITQDQKALERQKRGSGVQDPTSCGFEREQVAYTGCGYTYVVQIDRDNQCGSGETTKLIIDSYNGGSSCGLKRAQTVYIGCGYTYLSEKDCNQQCAAFSNDRRAQCGTSKIIFESWGNQKAHHGDASRNCADDYTLECHESRPSIEQDKDYRDWMQVNDGVEIQATGDEQGGGGGCFPAKSLVVLNGGKEKSMEDLHIGDVVMTVENGKLEPTTVLGFLDKKKNFTVPYLNLITEDGNNLFISNRHAMFIRENDVTRSVLAQDIKAGDKLIINHRNGFRFSEVVKITVAAKTGAYVPLTSSGTLLVDGVLVSSYTNGDHWLAHMLTTPLRWWPSFLLDTQESQDEEGIRTIPWLIREFATILGLATRAEEKSQKIGTSIFKMSQMTMTSIDKTEF